MQSAYLKKRNKLESTFQSAPKEAKNETSILPNSLLLSMQGGNSENEDNPELENIMKSRLAAFHHQIPAAENEADKLSSGITSGTPEQVKQSMGERLGTDFSSVRFHTGKSISQKADNMGARAWTQGNDIYFGEGGFHPTVAAHELVHTAQQGTVSNVAVNTLVPINTVQMWPHPFRRMAQQWRAWKQRRRQRQIQRQERYVQVFTPQQKQQLLPDMETQHTVNQFLRRVSPNIQMGQPPRNKRERIYQLKLLSEAILNLNLSHAQISQMETHPKKLILAQMRTLLTHLYDLQAIERERAREDREGPGVY